MADPTIPNRFRPTTAARDTPAGETLFRASLLDALDEAVIATDRDGRIVYWNDAADRLYGWSAQEVLGLDILDVTPALGSGDHAAEIMARLQRGQSWSGEVLVSARDGRIFPVHVTSSAVLDSTGRLVGIVGVSRDVSGHHEAQEALRESEERLELVHRATSTVIWEWDLRTDRVHWTDAVGEAFGYPPDEVEPTLAWWEERIHPDDRDTVVRELWDFVSSGRRLHTHEYRLRTADGSYARVFARAYLAMDDTDRPTRVVGSLVDLTARRRSRDGQRLLAQAGMMLELSLDYEAALPGVARLATHHFAGCVFIEVAGQGGAAPFAATAHRDPDAQPLAEAVSALLEPALLAGDAADRLAAGESLLIPVIDRADVDGHALPTAFRAIAHELGAVSMLATPIRARRSVLGVLVCLRFEEDPRFDMDDRLLGEELGRRIGLAVDSARLAHSAALADRAKSDFLAVVNHELRTPLTAVQGYADLLADEVSGTLTTKQKRQVDGIRSGAERLLRLIEGILLYARLEAGDERPNLAIVHFEPLLHRVVSLIEPQATRKGLEFRLDARELPASGCTDADKLLQILLALLTNAVKFSHAGAVSLTAAARDDAFVFDVTDTGDGIPAEHLPHVFNPFWQAEQPATRRAGGAGLGLSVARRLARVLGGDVVAARTSTSGTTFRVTLPARENL